MIVKKIRIAATCVLLPMLVSIFLLACGNTVQNETDRGNDDSDGGQDTAAQADPENRFGPEDYNADLVALSLENIEDVGDGIIYRRVSALETVVARSSEIIVLMIYEPGQAAMHQVQPWLEQLAADRSGSVLVILASNTSQDPFLDQFEQSGWPAFFVIRRASIELSLYGYSDENHNAIMNTLNDLTAG